MRHQRDICLLRRHIFKSHNHNSTLSVARYGSSKSHEPYILPRLVIDLDANDSQFVRQATEEDYAVKPKPPRRQPYDAKPLALHRRPIPYAFHSNTITAPDLLAYALLGNPNASPTSENLTLRKQFKYLKVHPLDNADTKTKRLTFGFTTDPSGVLESAGFIPEREPIILEEIRQCTSFPRLQRIILMLSSSIEGCAFLAAKGAEVVEGIRLCRKSSGDVTARAVLELLNNLFLSMQAKGIDCGTELCNAAMHYASRTFCLTSMRRYLDFSHSRSYSPNYQVKLAIENLAIGQRRPPGFHAARNKLMNEEDRRKSVLKLLTGWDLGGIPQPAEERKPSLASLVSAMKGNPLKKSSYWTYILSLGYIGAKEALWHEWRNFPEDLYRDLETRKVTFSESKEALRKFYIKKKKGEVFALAFLMAKDYEHAREVFTDLFQFKGPSNPREQYATGGEAKEILAAEDAWSTAPFVNHFQETLDQNGQSQPPSQQSLHLSFEFRQKLRWYYLSNHLVAKTRLLDRLHSVTFAPTPATALQAIDNWLVPDWIEAKESMHAPASDSFAQYYIDWVEQDGVEGVAIESFHGEILYFKPSSRSSSNAHTETSSDSSHAPVNEQ